MNRFYIMAGMIISLCSCRIHPGGAERSSTDDSKVYRLRLNPSPGSAYKYVISKESKLNLEVDSKQIDNIKKADVTIDYSIDKDSLDNFVIGILYNKIHVYTKTGDQETDIGGDNASASFDPMDKFLGALKETRITATVGRTGEVKKVTGYTEIANRILAEATSLSLGEKQKVQQQWQIAVEQGMIKKNMEQLFKMFPDSAVHIGDKWKLFSTENADINFMVKNFYILKSIKDGIADIESEGEIASDTVSAVLMGTDVIADLKGRQEGSYSMDIKTGMLLGCKVFGDVNGSIQMLGRTIPIKIVTSLKMDGQKVK
jgi:uncharacterized protein DUF6263